MNKAQVLREHELARRVKIQDGKTERIIEMSKAMKSNLIKQYNKTNDVGFKIKQSEAKFHSAIYDKQDENYIVIIEINRPTENMFHFFVICILTLESFHEKPIVSSHHLGNEDIFKLYNEMRYFKFNPQSK